MSPGLPATVFQQTMGTLLTTSWPIFGALLGVGLLVGVLQAATQINDSAVGFLPKLMAGLLVAWFMGGWMMDRWSALLMDMFVRMGQSG